MREKLSRSLEFVHKIATAMAAAIFLRATAMAAAIFLRATISCAEVGMHHKMAAPIETDGGMKIQLKTIRIFNIWLNFISYLSAFMKHFIRCGLSASQP